MDAYNTTLDQAVGDTTWLTGCNSWYFDDSGLPNAWPLHPVEYRRMLQHLDLSEYELSPRTSTLAATHR
jgi:hypothetical protein